MLLAMRSPAHDPSAIYRPRDCLAAVDCLCAAIVHLDFFTRLDRMPGNLADICQSLGTMARPTDVMLTLFAANGWIACDPNGQFRTTDHAKEFLVEGSPFDARSYYASMADRAGVADFLKVLRTDKPANWPGADGEADWHAAMRTDAFAESFTAAMDCRGRVMGPALAMAIDLRDVRTLLDVGGGSGVYAIACAEAYLHLQAIVMESPPVDAIARRTIQAATLANRIGVVVADMFTAEWPAGCDAHLFSNVLHDWDEPDCRRLIDASAAALPEGGRILIHDMLLNDDKTGPLWAAEYSVLLATVTQGRIYSTAEIRGWLATAGFRIVKHEPTALSRSVIEARRY